MTEPGHQQERRSEMRHHTSQDRLSWVREKEDVSHTGWVSNVAESSIAFVTPTRDQPTPGEAIELTFGFGSQSRQHQRVRVTRTVPYDQFFSIVGCRSESAERKKAGPPQPINGGTGPSLSLP
ncbi:MAG: hypothetical protein WBE26_19875 [Phycisphaerae bacterium]